MKGVKFFIVLAILMAFAITISATPSKEKTYIENEEDDSTSYDFPDTEITEVPSPENVEHPTSSLRRVSRFLAQKKPRATMTCDKYPRVCRTKGSAGPDCCKKKCVNVMIDKFNCGLCGRKCKYPEICCKGECVNPLRNKGHCGGCNNKCKKGNVCVYGMCSYA